MPRHNLRRFAALSSSAVIAAVSASLFSGIGSARHVAAASPPPFIDSDYVSQQASSNWQSWGCDQAEYSASQHVSTTQLVLDFGTTYDQNGQYGTGLFHNAGFSQWDSRTTTGNRYIVALFLTGYWDCRSTGWGVAPFINLIVGTNNEPSSGNNSTNAYWMGEVVLAVDTWIKGNGWGSLENAIAGIDIEDSWQGTGTESYSGTLSYLDAVLSEDGNIPTWNFGSLGGCDETSYHASYNCGGTGWTQAEFLYLNWGYAPMWPLPEEYNSASEKENNVWADPNSWEYYWIAKGSLQSGDGTMEFWASLTQYGECSQYGGCNGTNNTAARGWSDLYAAITSDSATSYGATCALCMAWSDDISSLPGPGRT